MKPHILNLEFIIYSLYSTCSSLHAQHFHKHCLMFLEMLLSVFRSTFFARHISVQADLSTLILYFTFTLYY